MFGFGSGGQLEKMRIKAYSDAEFSQEVPDGEYQVQVNPESYSFNYEVDFDENQAPGTSGRELRFNKINPENMDFEFIFDKTGALDDASIAIANPFGSPELPEDGIIPDLEKFKSVVFDYDGDIHRPRYVMLSWGTLLFKGCLKTLSLNFKLFKSDGVPIRATANASFEGFVEDNLRVAMENSQSPDLTHIRTVRKGDTLPYMCFEIYGDSSHYLEVAKANELTDFRNLEVGAEVFFPPIAKS